MHTSPRPIFWRTERNGVLLLLATVLLLLIMPWIERHPLGGDLLGLLFLLTIAAGVGVGLDRGRRRVGWLAALLTVGWLAARILGLAVPFGSGTGLRLPPLLALALILLILTNIFNALAVARRISAGVLAEAFTGYLLVAIAFALLFALLDELLPGAFNTAAQRAAADPASLAYFSLVTLSSVGFGDIVPIHPFVRIVAALEGVCGLFYSAVVVARLVAAYTPREMPPIEPSLDGAGDRDDPCTD